MGGVQRKLVLVVDDDEAVRSLVTKTLQAKGYEVQQAANGMAASELLGTMERQPDLLICDVMMPLVDGYSLVRLLRTHAELKSMPIIFLTARTQPEDLVIGINLGARHYVQKPFKLQELIDKVERSLLR
ncbi:MAG: response regulator [Myxococcota bacterium]|nr:response regulator [Myxococcota bacterium]